MTGYLGQEVTPEIADGWLPLFYSPYRRHVYAESLRNARPGFEIACPVTVNVNVPVAVGVPLIAPPLESDRPVGSAPLVIANVYALAGDATTL